MSAPRLVDESVRMPFGQGVLTLPVVPGATVVRPHSEPALDDVSGAVTTALRRPGSGRPLAAYAAAGMTVAISICDGTRAHPRREVLTPLLDELDRIAAGCDVTLLVATGSHRGNTREEFLAMLGAELVQRCRIENHDARDPGRLESLGTVAGDVPLFLNRTWTNADLRITAGVVEPHFFAGFSGGPKMVAPGLAGLDTILALHSFARIADPMATWGVLDGNPVHEAVARCAERMPPHIALEVRVNREQQVCDLAAGELVAAHRSLCERAKSTVMAPVPTTFDVVVTTNGGYPLDQSLYQAVKGLAAAERIIHDGATIVLLAECRDGMPAGSTFAALLDGVDSLDALGSRFGRDQPTVADQWQVQVLARVLGRARVVVHSTALTSDQLAPSLLETTPDPVRAVEAAAQAAGPGARVAYLPAGPYTVPYLQTG